MKRRVGRSARVEPGALLEFEPESGPDDFAAPEDLDAPDVDWLAEADDADEDVLRAWPYALPPRTTRHRLLGSALLVSAVLAVTGYGANAVYHRDLTADLTSDELILGASGGLVVSLPAADPLGSAEPGTARPRVAVTVPLVNQSPGAITLLPGASLLGAGLSGSSLGGSAAIVLAPGQSTVLHGYVTADCDGTAPDTGTATETSVMISARTAGGGLGVSAVVLESGGGSVRDRICAARSGASGRG